jgi:hypothetical protein
MNVPVTEIGMVAEGEGARFLDSGGKSMTLSRLSYSHF